ncbi:MAG: DNA/RNA non-specific endonuclease [Planctomycetota bacterium]|jgi:endonuclease G
MRPIVLALFALISGCAAPPGAQTPGILGGLFGDEAIIAADLMPYGFPGTEMLRYRKGYVLSYDAARRVPRWVAERLDPGVLEGEVPEDEKQFAPDTSIPFAIRATSEDFRDSEFVRGRLAAAANHKSDVRVFRETYLLSNVAPQLGAEFRSSFWVHLEGRIRDWARDSDDLFVVTGTLFLPRKKGEDVQYRLIGRRQVAVPTHFFKVVMRERKHSRAMIAFLVPHEPMKSGGDPARFLVTVDRLEELSGLDFFPQLGEPTQTELESAEIKTLWPAFKPDNKKS